MLTLEHRKARNSLRTGLAGILLCCLSACSEDRTTQEERETLMRMAAREGRATVSKSKVGHAAQSARVSQSTVVSRSARQP